MKVLIIAAHPDDEVLGVGGTIARHVDEGDLVTIVVCAEGATVRYDHDVIAGLQDAARRAALALGVHDVRFLGLRDQHLDAQPILTVIQAIERVVREVQPEIVYTHHRGDVNRDHAVVSEAVMVACRPVGDHPRAVYLFETPSSTEWAWPMAGGGFAPQHFVDIGATLARKLAAMACYETELRPAPHPRSLDALRVRAAYWGQHAGLALAEPFVVARQIR
jgi:LmbE family N-acetylglucosaminyl deacetylase